MAPRTKKAPEQAEPARIEYLYVKNFRALREVELTDITPLTVLLGPNGSGKSTVFDVFNFLSECFQIGLRRAWDKRGRFRELRTRGQQGPIVFELVYRETPGAEPATYHLEIDEGPSGPVVVNEWLKWRRVARNVPGAPFKILSFSGGVGWVISGERPEKTDKKVRERLDEPELLAVSTLGRLGSNPRVAALRRFITDWHVSYLSIDATRGQPDAGPQERLEPPRSNRAKVPSVTQATLHRGETGGVCSGRERGFGGNGDDTIVTNCRGTCDGEAGIDTLTADLSRIGQFSG